jgi:hypothetical protein
MLRQLTLEWFIITYHWIWKRKKYVLIYCLRANTNNKRLPMDVKTSPDIFQRIMYELLGDIPNTSISR